MLRILSLLSTLLVAFAGLAHAPASRAAQQPPERLILYIDGDTPLVKRAIARYEAALLRRGITARYVVTVRHVPVDVFNRGEATQRLATEIKDQPAVIIATSSESAGIARAVTATIPIVFGSHQDPVRIGLVRSLAQPGGNLTGFTSAAPIDMKRLELLRELAPRARRLGIVIDHWWMDETDGEALLREVHTRLGFEGRVFLMERPEDMSELKTAIARDIDAWYVPQTTLPFHHPGAIVSGLAALRKPVVYPTAWFVEAGGLSAYQPRQSLEEALDQFAKLTGLILDGVPPGQIPIERPKSFELVVNAGEARRLGIRLSDALLRRADRVIDKPAQVASP
jgi:putative ABC transport system substrate-binding protein